MSDTRIVKKIRKLLKLARGKANAAECASALAMAQRLMAQHRLTESDVADVNDTCGLTVVWRGKRLAEWRKGLWASIAEANGCCVIVGRGARLAQLCVIGQPEDVEVVRYMARYITQEIERLCVAEWDSQLHHAKLLVERYGHRMRAEMPELQRFRDGFKAGAVYVVHERMREEQKEAEQSQDGSMALVVVGSRLAAAQQWRDEKVQNLREGEVGPLDADRRAFSAGARAARNIGLTRPSEQLV